MYYFNGVGKEIKSGRVSRSAYKDQVLKDIEIVKEKIQGIDKIEWHCFENIDESFINNLKTELNKVGLSMKDFEIIKY